MSIRARTASLAHLVLAVALLAPQARAEKPCSEVGVGLNPAQPAIPTIERQPDPDGMNRLIQRFRPIIYLHKDERYFPMGAELYFASTHTSLWDKAGNKELVPAGQLTMRKIYDEFVKRGKISGKVYVKNHECAKVGTRPAKDRPVPVYGLAFEQSGSWYLQYVIFWGYNGSYPLAFAGFKFKPQIGGQHWGDIEHNTLKLNRAKTDIDELYFAAHGGDDGMTLPRRMLEIDKATGRPVVYAAVNGHGSYPKAGLYVRVATVASDVTGKHVRWDPTVSRVFPDTHRSFQPETMGWVYVPGDIGPDGISALGYKDWFVRQGSVGGKPPRGVPCEGRACAGVEKPAFGPLANWCSGPNDKVCILKKIGQKAVWKPIADEIQSTLKKKVGAPLKKGVDAVKDAAKKAKKKLKFW